MDYEYLFDTIDSDYYDLSLVYNLVIIKCFWFWKIGWLKVKNFINGFKPIIY